MCGICGILNSDKTRTIERERLINMNKKSTHRGPDEEGYYLKDNVGLGMRRLSIIDVKGGHLAVWKTFVF
jgi:asparagine synthase (glutamine-hydrolysing)